jgi:hypothetical protein
VLSPFKTKQVQKQCLNGIPFNDNKGNPSSTLCLIVKLGICNLFTCLDSSQTFSPLVITAFKTF